MAKNGSDHIMIINEDKVDHVWRAIRLSFFAFVILSLVIGIILIYVLRHKAEIVILSMLLFLLLVVSIFNSINSIVHIIKQKNKRFAILSLVLSSLFIVLVLSLVLSYLA